MSDAKKIYFLSDFHLGAPNHGESLVREKKIIAFLDSIFSSAKAIFIVGDLFDFWYEYKRVVPKGYVRILGKLAQITDAGIPIYFFVGNHDMWMKNYFQQELNIQVFFEPREFTFSDKKFLIGHGDGLGPGDAGYKLIKKIFRNNVAQAFFGALPPAFGIGLADYFSRKSRAKTGKTNEVYLGDEKEWLLIYAKEILQKHQIDFFIFGHRHLPLNINIAPNSQYINLGDWITYFTYAVFDGTSLTLEYYEKNSA